MLSKSSSKVDRKQGAVLRMYKILGKVKAFRSRVRASCACRSFNLSPKVCKECIFDPMAELTDISPPMGDPRSMALGELTTVKDGKADIIVDTALSSSLMISLYLVLRTRPRSFEASIRNLESLNTSSTGPSKVPSSRYIEGFKRGSKA